MAQGDMKRVFCAESGKLEWGNAKKDSERDRIYRCVKCGRDHPLPMGPR